MDSGNILGYTYLLFILFSYGCTLSITIDDRNGENSPNCFKDESHSCRSLEYIAASPKCKNSQNLTVTIISPTLTLSEVIVFSNVTNFTLRGIINKNTTILCGNTSSNFMIEGAAISFMNSQTVQLHNFTIKECGGRDGTLNGSLLVSNTTNLSVQRVRVFKSFGYGLAIYNTNGRVSIQHCKFKHNGHSPTHEYGGGSGGVYIGIDSKEQTIHNGHYTVNNCTFYNNSANKNLTQWIQSGNHGGGMHIILANSSFNNTINILHCHFNDNTAGFGGGLYIKCQSLCNNTSIQVDHTYFHNNSASIGGGGVDVGYASQKTYYPMHNSMTFYSCHFDENYGIFGGGVGVFTATSNSAKQYENIIRFENCKFNNNSANGGAAVDINNNRVSQNGSFFITKTYFSNCSFTKNIIAASTTSSRSKITQSGAFFTSRVYAWFTGNNTFEDNEGTALYVSSTTVEFNNSITIFKGNKGEKGGAILLVGESYLRLIGQVHFTFENNTASYGGAICAVTLETHYFQYTEICFISTRKDDPKHTFEFIDNTATTLIGNDMFVSNLIPCLRYCDSDDQKTDNVTVLFKHSCLGNFSKHPSVATATSNITVESSVEVIPGFYNNLNISQTDQFGNDVGKIFPLSARIAQMEGKVSIDSNSVLINNNEIKLFGNPGDTATLILQTNAIAVIKASIHVTLSQCPPGLFLDSNIGSCNCSADQNSTYKYSGISYCKNDGAYLRLGNWAGYLNPHNKTDETFATGSCVYRICSFKGQKSNNGHYCLNTNTDLLENLVCGNVRRGILCGRCIDNYTVYYHSPYYSCKVETSLCTYGIVFYILSELLPVTVLFLIILIFNIHLTSGALYSFIFYAQVLDTLYVDAFGALHFNTPFSKLLNVYKVIYGIFDFNIFVSEKLSFCIYKNITVMDLFLFQYSTIIYALLLILVTIVILKVNSLYTCIKLCHKCGRRNIRGSVINGLTAFLVLCYFKCVNVTFSILIPVHIYSKNKKQVPLFNGELEYMKGEHLKYAIPAFICLFMIILPPPLILLSDSILIKLNSSFHFKRNRFTYYLLRIRMKIMPFLDSFQGCFKDNCRCFAGMFFAYRILILLPYTYSGDTASEYTCSEIFLFIIIIIHFFARPFQKTWHNHLDLFLLANLLLVNMLTIVHYHTSLQNTDQKMQKIFNFVQVMFITIPLVYISVYFGYNMCIRFKCFSTYKKKFCNKFSRLHDINDDESLPDRLINEDTNIISTMSTYHTF